MSKNKSRLDMSNWVVHFVHNPNPEYDPAKWYAEKDLQNGVLPYINDSEKDNRFAFWIESDKTYGQPYSAFHVLLKILHDGHIRSSWSFRGGRSTIYGPRSACCFTEMPLYALLHYAAEQKDSSNVSAYGICLLKDQFYQAGGRPVIYGTTEAYVEDNPARWPMKLPETSGLMEQEQYRFVPFDLTRRKPIDWSHEREWRWCDSKDHLPTPGLPVWLDEGSTFRHPIVLVKTKEEASRILRQIKNLFDSKELMLPIVSASPHLSYDLEALKTTAVVALDEVLKVVASKGIENIQVSDIPVEYLSNMVIPQPTLQTELRVRKALAHAKAAARQAAQLYRDIPHDDSDEYSHVPDGFANVTIYNPQSEVTQAFINIGATQGISGVGYFITEATSDGCETPDIIGAQLVANAAMGVLKTEFPDEAFSVWYDLY